VVERVFGEVTSFGGGGYGMTVKVIIKRFMDDEIITIDDVVSVEICDEYLTVYSKKGLILGQFRKEYVIGHYLFKGGK
jgi:hypothetical protein